jgi:hypothetical protein
MPQERHYYSSRSLNFPPVCSWCAETSEEAFVDGTAYESREGKKVHPLCSSCAALGQPPQFYAAYISLASTNQPPPGGACTGPSDPSVEITKKVFWVRSGMGL